MASSQNSSSPVSTARNSSHEDAGETQSESSTSCYDASPIRHEPFETLQPKIAALARSHFRIHSSKIEVEHMKGGSFNRVAAVTTIPETKCFTLPWLELFFLGTYPKPKKYIVRIPRHDSDASPSSMRRKVAILKTVEALVPLPTPDVVAYDLTADNAIGKPYILQSCLPGQNLYDLWNSDTLNLAQRKCIVRQVAQLASTIAKVEGPGGIISPEALSSKSSQLHVESLHLEHECLGDQSYTLPDKPETACEHLLAICYRWYEYYQKADQRIHKAIYYNLGIIIKYLGDKGFLNGPCVLAHQDLMPYNLLAEVRSESDVAITGVIDWDSATIAPRLVAFEGPDWVWDETAAYSSTSEQAESLKQVFLEHACEEYKRLAFSPEAVLGRRIYSLLREGVSLNRHLVEARSIFHRWEDLHPEDKLQLFELEVAFRSI